MFSKILVVKAIGYRIFSILITFIVTYLFTRDLPTTTGITVVVAILGTVGYYFYDLVFDKLGYITAKSKEIEGIKGGYPLIPLSEKLKGLVALMRPLTMTGGFIAGFFLVVLASYYYNTPFTWNLAFLVGMILALVHAGAQTANQVVKEEIEIDRINKPYRPIVREIIKREEGIIFCISLFTISIAMCFFVSPKFLLWILVISFFSIFYSAPPLRVKKIFILNNLWQGVARGLLPVVAVFSIFSSSLFPPFFAIALGSVIGMWVVGGQSSKDIDDIEGDKQFGIRNFFTVLGEKNALKLMLIIMICSFTVLDFYIAFGILPVTMLALNMLIIPSLGITHFLNKKITITENNIGWALFYSTIGLWYILPAICFSL